ncbi:hypothetical protein [Thalassobellus citreus]|uniref:hypothetical protein n=1 Tax=Thalassobellus citreus TaxID=3367752 RepID=UPI0037ACE940
MAIVLIILGVIFLYWSLVPKKPKQPTFNDIINNSERKQGKYANVYKSTLSERTLGMAMYYYGSSPEDPTDKKVFSGTENECQIYVSKRMNTNL